MADSQALKAQFEEQGFLHLRSFIDSQSCEKLIFRMRDLVAMRLHKEPRAFFIADEKNHSQDDFLLQSARKISLFFDPKARFFKKVKEDPFYSLNKVGHALHDLCPVYRKFSHQPRFFDLMKTLGLQSPRLLQSMFIFKQSGFGDAVPAHQDATFLYTEPNSAIGLWFALEDTNEQNGCLWVLPKGHKGPLKHRYAKKDGAFSFIDGQKVDWPRENYFPLHAKKGDVIVLHGLLPHLSEQNLSSKTRFALTLHFIDKKAHYPKNNWLSIF